MYPALRNCVKIVLSIGMLSISHTWQILAKQPLVSPSKTNCAEVFLLKQIKAYWHASCVLLYFMKPNEHVSAVASAIGLNARAYSACIALSYLVGILKGRFFVEPGFGL